MGIKPLHNIIQINNIIYCCYYIYINTIMMIFIIIAPFFISTFKHLTTLSYVLYFDIFECEPIMETNVNTLAIPHSCSLSKNDNHLSIFNEKWAKQYFYLRSEGTKYNELK